MHDFKDSFLKKTAGEPKMTFRRDFKVDLGAILLGFRFHYK